MLDRVLVTGGAGFIGSHVVDSLVERGCKVTVVDDLSNGLRANVSPQANFYELSILDPSLAEVMIAQRVQAVLHLAAQVSASNSVRRPITDATTNAVGTLRVLEACFKAGVSRLVHTSSAAVYGDPDSLPVAENHAHVPISPYGLHKDLVGQYLEFYHREKGLNYSNLYLANVYGPRQLVSGEAAVVPAFINNILQGDPITIHGDGTQTRDFIYVVDVAEAIIAAAERPLNRSINISTGKGTSIQDLAELLCEIASLPSRIVHGPSRVGDIQHSVLSNELARGRLDWEPVVPLRTGLLQTIAYTVRQMELEGFRRQAILGALDELDRGKAQTAASLRAARAARRDQSVGT